MNVKEYAEKIYPTWEVGEEKPKQLGLNDAYAVLLNALNDDDISKKDYMYLHGRLMRLKADYDGEEEVFIQSEKDVDLLQLVLDALWKSGEFVIWYPTDEDGYCDGIDTIDTEKVEEWLKEYLEKNDF